MQMQMQRQTEAEAAYKRYAKCKLAGGENT